MGTNIWKQVLLWVSFIFFLGSLLLRQEAAINQDLGRHLRLGEMIVSGPPSDDAGEARKCALFTNCLTYTYPNYPFINHHWGSEVIFYLVHKIGGFPALIILKTIVLGLAFAISIRHAITPKGLTLGSPRLDLNKLTFAIALTFFSVQMMADRLTARPEIFGYLLFSLLFWILDKKDLSNWRNPPNWMVIPIIMILWVNLHISFVFGLILVWIWAGSRIIQKMTNGELRMTNGNFHSTFNIRHSTFIFTPAISTLVTLFNPSGLRGALMPLSIMKDYGYTIVENMTPFFLRAFKPQPEYWIYALILLMTIILGAVRGFGGIGVFRGITLLVFSVFPLIAVRHLAFFGLVVAPVMVPLIINALKGPTLAPVKVGPYHTNGKFAKLPILVAGSLLIAALTDPAPLAHAKMPTVGLAADRRHEEAVKFVKDHDLQGRMWNNYDIGSFLEWSLPEYPTFVDGRPEAFPVGFFQKTYIPMQQNQELWDQKTSEYNIQWAFAALTDATPWFQKWWQLIQQSKNWKIIYLDDTTAVLVRLDGLNKNIKPIGKARTIELLTIDKSPIVK